MSFNGRNADPSPLPPLRLSAPALSARLDGPVTLSTLARLVASGTAVSKADLVQAAGLARTTVSNGVDELLHRGVLRVVGTRPTPGRGRPADRLALSPGGGHVLVADLGAHGAHLAVVDLSQTMRAHVHVDIDVAVAGHRTLQGVAVATVVVQPLRDARDRSRAGTRGPQDLRVRPTRLKLPHDMPALRQVVQLSQRAQVAEEALSGGAVWQREDRVEKVLGRGRAPLVGFGAHLVIVAW